MALETIAYTNPVTKTTITFGDNSLPNVIFQGITGIGLAPVDNFVVDTAYQPGAFFVRTKTKPTPITINLAVFGSPTSANPRADLWNTVNTILSTLAPSILYTGTLTKTDSTGVQRQITNVQYVGGHEIADIAANYAYLKIDLIFEAYNPYWYSVAQHQQSLGASSDPFGFSVPISVPLSVSGQAQGGGTITNAGNINSSPIFTFNGPCQNFSVSNQTTNQSFAISQNLAAGDTIVVDCNAGTVTWTPAGGSATPLYSAFSGAKQWINLAPGNNSLVFYRDVAGNQQCVVSWYDTWNHG